MRWAVQYESKSGVVGLCLFRAESLFEALEYLVDRFLRTCYTRNTGEPEQKGSREHGEN
jgi:hypothetical protein